ncbi:MAG: hypothetical protein OHK0046_14860 [Anaerolineae bacterium]
MAKIEQSVVINAPWQMVDSVSTDGARLPEWFAGVESVEVTGGFPEVGGKVDAKYKASGIGFDLVIVSTAYERGSYLTTSMSGMITGTQHWAINPLSDEQTELSVTFDYEVPGGGVGKVLDKLVIERTNKANIEKSLENLKNLVES